MVEPAVRIEGLRVRRGGRLVLPAVSIAIRRGAVTGLLGPSGSGKTTLIRSIVGVQIVEAGEVSVFGLPAGTPALRRRVAYVTQAPSVYGDLTVRENLGYFARVLDVPRVGVEEAIGTAGLGDLAGRVAGTGSGGERSRASLAVALLGDPELLVLDEPTVGLDPVLRRDLWETWRRDPHTLALLLVVPPLLLVILKYVFEGQEQTFERIGVPLVGLFPFITMFLVTSIAMPRERTTGTLERLMFIPLAKLDLLVGYGLAFALVAAVQATVTALVGFGLLGLVSESSVGVVVAIAILNAVLGMALSLFLSAFAQTEFQAVQFMPAVVLPQILLAGLFVPRESMARFLELISDVFPLTYAYDALARATSGKTGSRFALDVVVVCGCIVLALALGATTLRRRTG